MRQNLAYPCNRVMRVYAPWIVWWHECDPAQMCEDVCPSAYLAKAHHEVFTNIRGLPRCLVRPVLLLQGQATHPSVRLMWMSLCSALLGSALVVLQRQDQRKKMNHKCCIIKANHWVCSSPCRTEIPLGNFMDLAFLVGFSEVSLGCSVPWDVTSAWLAGEPRTPSLVLAAGDEGFELISCPNLPFFPPLLCGMLSC